MNFNPNIVLTAELTAKTLGISIEKADELLSGPETQSIIQTALAQAIERTLDETVKQMARCKWPSVMDQSPIRRDVTVELTGLPTILRSHL